MLVPIILSLVLETEQPRLETTVCVITEGGGVSTGFKVANDATMTARHAISPDKTLVAPFFMPYDECLANSQVEVVEPILDVAIITSSTGEVAPPSFARPVVDEEVYTEGYTFGKLSFFRGRVNRVEKFVSWLDVHIMEGASGSAVFNKDGKIVGMIVADFTDGYNGATIMVNGEWLEVVYDHYVALQKIRDVSE